MQAPDLLLSKMGTLLSQLPQPATSLPAHRVHLHHILVQVGSYQQDIVVQRQHARKLAIHLSRWLRRHLRLHVWQVRLSCCRTGHTVLLWQHDPHQPRQPFAWLARAATHRELGRPGLRERSLPTTLRQVSLD